MQVQFKGQLKNFRNIKDQRKRSQQIKEERLKRI